MKKIFVIVALVALCAVNANAQTHVGVKGGVVFDNLNLKSGTNNANFDAKTGFEAGFVLQSQLGSGFAIQPELLFVQKGAELNASVASVSYTMSNIEIPIGFQWGYQVDASLNLRPFISVAPYASFAVNRTLKYGVGLIGYEGEVDLSDSEWDGMKKFDYGFHFGVGLDIWKIQVMAKYDLGLGNVFDFTYNNWDLGKANFNGFTISAAILF